ncbi:unnamed protein product, partial [Symbiodinium natans]
AQPVAGQFMQYGAYGMPCGGCVAGAMGMDPTAYAAAMGNPYGAQAVYMQVDPRSAKQFGTVKVFNPEK